MANSGFQVGAGTAEIRFPAQMFPVEGFGGIIHDLPHARVLLLQNKEKVAIVALELVNASDEVIEICKQIIHEKTQTELDHIWIHSTHAITTPHAPPNDVQNRLFAVAVKEAIQKAVEQAAGSLCPAVMGVGTGYCDVNSNRDIELNGAWYYGMGGTMESNKTMTILRFDSLENTPIGFLISYGVKPTCINNAEMDQNTRQITTDVPGVACTMLEKTFDAPALFCMSSAGDQVTKELCLYYTLNEDGEVAFVERSVEEGLGYVAQLGAQMGDAAIAIAKSIVCGVENPTVAYTATSYPWANKAGDGQVEISVEGIQLGDAVALVGMKPETNCVTELELWERSPFPHTLILSFVNGDQKYMPDRKAYQLETWEFRRSGCGVGCAEEFVRVATDLLEDLLKGKIKKKKPDVQRNFKPRESQTISFAGYRWFVLEVKQEKALVLCEAVLETRAYHSPGGAITWENCELREYLNGAFYQTAFTAAEQSKILEMEIENQSNPKYGVRGGNATYDKVFLLSLQQAQAYLFGFPDLLIGRDVKTGNPVWWHLRSPGEGVNVAASVNAAGAIDYHGVNDGVSNPTGGVRPAMWLKLS